MANSSIEDSTNSDDSLKDLFTNDPVNLIGQSHRYIFKSSTSAWHNDTFSTDFFNYFVRRVSNSSRLLDPHKDIPTFDDVARPLSKAYSYLFAVWLGINKEHLFVSREQDSTAPIEGWRLQQEQRLFLSTPMFIISEVILCIYVIVGIAVYMRRPGQYLPRLPTSIAAVIALFAASSAVLDMRGTSHLDGRGRARHLEKLDSRYGYGSYVGGDGRVHIGIEKTPFVRARTRTTWLEKKLPMLRKFSADS